MTDPDWQKCRSPFLPRRTVDGDWTALIGQTWRRKVDGQWQYRQEKETLDEIDARAW